MTMALFDQNHAPLGHPLWWDDVIWPTPTGDLPARADLVVVGAGHTGLSAAIAAHDAGAHVVVIDAGVPGQGASTRNGGMVGAHPRLSWADLSTTYGEDTTADLFAEAEPALQFVRDLIEREKIDCDFTQCGRIQMAWTPAHFESKKQLARLLQEKSGSNVQVVNRADLTKHVGTGQYFGGLLFPDHGALHPQKYHSGLLRAVLARGIAVVPNCPATAITQYNVTTPQGHITTKRMVLATNGYTPDHQTWFRHRIFALPSYIIATQELPRDVIGAIAPGGHTMVETRARHSYFRISPCGKRILWGGRAAMVNIDLRRAARRLHATMCDVWPSMRDVKLTHVWSGNTGYSFTHMPHVGLRGHMAYAMGFSGSGTVMAPYLGAKAAYLALGDARAKTAYQHTHLKRHALHPTHQPLFLHAANFWYHNWVDRMETWKAKQAHKGWQR